MTCLSLKAPASKSMTQRALVLAALSPGTTEIAGALVCDDSRHLTTLLRGLGCEVRWRDDHATVSSRPLVAPAEPVFCGNAGTAVRFGACLSLLCEGALTIDGDAHMRERPIAGLGDALAAMGMDVRYLGKRGCPPLRASRVAPPPARVRVDASLSSQYASGLLLVAPCLPAGLVVELEGSLVSVPYLHMTTTMMARAGARPRWLDERTVAVAPGGYPPLASLEVEADWSGAAFLLAAGALTGLDITVPHLVAPERSLQGDAAFTSMAHAVRAGAPLLDLTDVPDLIAPLTALCLFAARPVRIRGAAHTRVKECDRVHVLCRELGKLGAVMREHDDGLDVEPLTAPRPGPHTLDPEGDHRMAMTFGLVSLRVPAVSVTEPDCVTKSFPDFWDKLKTIRAHLGDDHRP